MARSKYTPENVEAVLEALRATGSDKKACAEVGVSLTTFYAWQEKYPDFLKQVAQAKRSFREAQAPAIRQQAQRAFLDYLFGRAEEVWTSTETIRMGDRLIEKETVKRVRRPPAVWAIERVLGKQVPLLEAMQMLLNEGVATLEQAQVVSDGLTGIEQSLRSLNAKPMESTEEPEDGGDRGDPEGE